MQKNDKNKTKKNSIKVLSHLNKMSKPLHFVLKKFSAQLNSSYLLIGRRCLSAAQNIMIVNVNADDTY